MFMYVSDLLDTQSTKNNLSYYIPEKTFWKYKLQNIQLRIATKNKKCLGINQS